MPAPTATHALDRATQGAARLARWGFGHAIPRLAIRSSAKRGDLHAQLIETTSTSEEVPVELFDRIRATGPLHRAKFAYVTATHQVVKEVLASPDVAAGVELGGDGPFSAIGDWAFRSSPMGPLTPPSLLVTEPPDHTRYRKLVTRVFSVRAVDRLRGRTEKIAADLIAGLDPTSPLDLVEQYCAQLPLTVIAEILGVPAEDHQRVLEFGSAAAPSLDLGLDWDTFTSVETALRDFEAWLADHLEAVRRRPGDDLLSQLVTARDEDGVGLSDAELRAIAGLVLAAGFETTVNLLGNGVALLHEHPAQLRRLQADPSLWPTAVDEILRIDPPVLLTGRMVTRDTTFAGVPVAKGALVTTLLAGANRDPEVFEDPGRFDVARANAGEHVSFSSGRHYCLGAALARMEGEVGLRSLFDAFPDLRVLPGAQRRTTRILRGYAVLPVRLDG